MQNCICLLTVASPTLTWEIPQAHPLQKVHLFIASQLVKAAKQSQPHVLDKHKPNEICLEISLGFPLDFYFGEPKNPKAINNTT